MTSTSQMGFDTHVLLELQGEERSASSTSAGGYIVTYTIV